MSKVGAGVLGDGHTFFCEPAVPWRIEIAIFGSFAIALLTRMAEARDRARQIYPLILITFLWIAPFYGFFDGPVFLAIGLVTGCPDRGFMTVVLVALGMVFSRNDCSDYDPVRRSLSVQYRHLFLET